MRLLAPGILVYNGVFRLVNLMNSSKLSSFSKLSGYAIVCGRFLTLFFMQRTELDSNRNFAVVADDEIGAL